MKKISRLSISTRIISKPLIAAFTSLLLISCAANKPLITQSSLFNKVTKADVSPQDGYRSGNESNIGWNRDRNRNNAINRVKYKKVEKFPGKDNIAPRKFNFQGAKKVGDGYSLNFDNAKLSELVKVILTDTLNTPYLFDPRVTGQVTLTTGKSISREELLFTLETILQMNNAIMVKEGKLFRILPAALGQSTRTLNVDYASEKERIGPGYGITIFPLKFVSADVMRNILSSFTNTQSGLNASIVGNMLFIRGSGRERKTLVELALSFDVDWMKGQSAGIYVLENTSPDEVLPELENIFKTKNGRGRGLVRFQTIKRLNAILALTSNSKFLDKVSVWVKRLDRTNSAAENLFVYRVENGKAKNLVDILNKMFTGKSSGGSDNTRSVAPGRETNRLTSNTLRDTNTGGNQGNDNNSSDREKNVSNNSTNNTGSSGSSGSSLTSGSEGSSGDVKIIADAVNNKILIRASQRQYRQILKVLKRIDRMPVQVLINATLAEVTLNDNLRYGVQFFLQKSGGKKGSISFSTGNAVQVTANQFPGLNFLFGSISQPKVVLDALASETDVKVVSSPSVVVLHNQTASLQVGNEVPIATRQSSSVQDPQAPIVNEIRFRKTGVILKVTPRISSNGLVTMEIDQEISSVQNTQAVGDTGAGTLTPTISQRRISSTIAVNSGQMVVLGGLISERNDNLQSGIPGVRKVPVIGKVVGANNNRGKMRTELVIFLQPTVIRNSRDAANIADSVRRSLAKFAPSDKEREEKRLRKRKQWEKQKAAWKTLENNN